MIEHSTGWIEETNMSRKFRLTLIASLFAALPAAGQSAQAGNGQDLVKDKCNSCHVLEARVGGGYTEKGWATVMRMMVAEVA